MQRLVLTLALLLSASPVYAQTGVPLNYHVIVYAAGGSTPATPALTVAASAVACDLAPLPGINNAENPRRIGWDDPQRAGRMCAWTDDGTGPLRVTLANGAYEFAVRASNADGPGPESPRVPFTRRQPNPPGVLTGPRVIQ